MTRAANEWFVEDKHGARVIDTHLNKPISLWSHNRSTHYKRIIFNKKYDIIINFIYLFYDRFRNESVKVNAFEQY